MPLVKDGIPFSMPVISCGEAVFSRPLFSSLLRTVNPTGAYRSALPNSAERGLEIPPFMNTIPITMTFSGCRNSA
jgi:hypothetical protein